MAPFVACHEHEAEHCPAKDPPNGATLLNRFGKPSAWQPSEEIPSEPIVEGEHMRHMIVRFDSKDRVDKFVKPFAMMGCVTGEPATTRVRVVASGG